MISTPYEDLLADVLENGAVTTVGEMSAETVSKIKAGLGG